MIDSGGSSTLIKNLKETGVNPLSIKDIFISHAHTDHVLGLIWLFKYLGAKNLVDNIKGKINIYCNIEVYNAITTVAELTLQKGIIRDLKDKLNYVILNDGDKHKIGGNEYTFFDIKSPSVLQFGFETVLDNKKVVFLGDETINDTLCDKINGVDYVFHEAFCLSSEEKKFNPRVGGHATVKDVACIMEKCKVKNLILIHMKENLGKKRKKRYLDEALEFYNGNVFVPDDLDIIEIK